jgi:hypothetical protein
MAHWAVHGELLLPGIQVTGDGDDLRTVEAGITLRPCGALRACITPRALRASIALGTLRSCFAVGALRACVAPRALRAYVTLGALRACLALETLRACVTLGTLRAYRT